MSLAPGRVESEATLRERVVEALGYPRRLMAGSLALETCTHAGHHAPRQPDCRACENGLECQWLTGHDQHVDLRRKSTRALTEALELAFSYVDARVTLDGHDSLRCRCEACSWLRDAERLLVGLR